MLIRLKLFADAQDKASLKVVCEAVQDADWWNFLESSCSHCFRSCEESRRWGMVCECPEHVRLRTVDRQKHVACFFNSRRLRGAWPYLLGEKEATRERRRTLTQADCGNSRATFLTMKQMLARKIAGIDLRFGYLAKLPWAFARADTAEGATEVMRLLALVALELQDGLTRRIMAKVGGDIARRAAGEAASPALLETVARINEAALAEDCGEGLWIAFQVFKIGDGHV